MKRLLACVIMTLLVTTSCASGAPSDEELLNALSELTPKARELYTIVYGDSLEHEAEAGTDGYYAVAETAEYQSIAELKAAMSDVFSTGYLEILYNTAFNGVSEDEGSIEAKFIEKDDGLLYVNPTVTEDFGEARELDLSGAEVSKSNKYKAIITIPDGDSTLEISLQKSNGEWKIDSAIY